MIRMCEIQNPCVVPSELVFQRIARHIIRDYNHQPTGILKADETPFNVYAWFLNVYGRYIADISQIYRMVNGFIDSQL